MRVFQQAIDVQIDVFGPDQLKGMSGFSIAIRAGRSEDQYAWFHTISRQSLESISGRINQRA
jgi:hypothetical protein